MNDWSIRCDSKKKKLGPSMSHCIRTDDGIKKKVTGLRSSVSQDILMDVYVSIPADPSSILKRTRIRQIYSINSLCVGSRRVTTDSSTKKYTYNNNSNFKTRSCTYHFSYICLPLPPVKQWILFAKKKVVAFIIFYISNNSVSRAPSINLLNWK